MKRPRYPKGLFYTDHSGTRQWRVSDIPMLRAMRDAYRHFMDRCRSLDLAAEGPAMALAASMALAEMQERFDACGRILDLLESTPSGWRP